MQPLEGFTEVETLAYGWHYQCLPGFDRQLMQTIVIASAEDASKLQEVYPEHVMAIANYTSNLGWWQELNQRLIKKGIVKHEKS